MFPFPTAGSPAPTAPRQRPGSSHKAQCYSALRAHGPRVPPSFPRAPGRGTAFPPGLQEEDSWPAEVAAAQQPGPQRGGQGGPSRGRAETPVPLIPGVHPTQDSSSKPQPTCRAQLWGVHLPHLSLLQCPSQSKVPGLGLTHLPRPPCFPPSPPIFQMCLSCVLKLVSKREGQRPEDIRSARHPNLTVGPWTAKRRSDFAPQSHVALTLQEQQLRGHSLQTHYLGALTLQAQCLGEHIM